MHHARRLYPVLTQHTGMLPSKGLLPRFAWGHYLTRQATPPKIVPEPEAQPMDFYWSAAWYYDSRRPQLFRLFRR